MSVDILIQKLLDGIQKLDGTALVIGVAGAALWALWAMVRKIVETYITDEIKDWVHERLRRDWVFLLAATLTATVSLLTQGPWRIASIVLLVVVLTGYPAFYLVRGGKYQDSHLRIGKWSATWRSIAAFGFTLLPVLTLGVDVFTRPPPVPFVILLPPSAKNADAPMGGKDDVATRNTLDAAIRTTLADTWVDTTGLRLDRVEPNLANFNSSYQVSPRDLNNWLSKAGASGPVRYVAFQTLSYNSDIISVLSAGYQFDAGGYDTLTTLGGTTRFPASWSNAMALAIAYSISRSTLGALPAGMEEAEVAARIHIKLRQGIADQLDTDLYVNPPVAKCLRQRFAMDRPVCTTFACLAGDMAELRRTLSYWPAKADDKKRLILGTDGATLLYPEEFACSRRAR